MSLGFMKRMATGIAAFVALPLAGCQQNKSAQPPTIAQQQQEQAKESTHIAPDRQAAIHAQVAAQANIKPE